MSVPARARLLDFLVEAFEAAELKSLVKDHFAEAHAELSWHGGLRTQADDLVGWLERRFLIARLSIRSMPSSGSSRRSSRGDAR
jgi:hypothetical protein